MITSLDHSKAEKRPLAIPERTMAELGVIGGQQRFQAMKWQ